MGGMIGRVTYKAARPVQNYNVEERAFKVISRDKPTPAPPHPRMQAIMDEIKNDPTLLTKDKLDTKTVEHLTKVFIKSEGDNPIIETKKKNLPKLRGGVEEYEYGYEDPPNIPKGKASMRQILEILNAHESKPKENTPEHLSKLYNLSEQDVVNLLKYFKPFQVYLPKKEARPKGIRMPSMKLLQQKLDSMKDQTHSK